MNQPPTDSHGLWITMLAILLFAIGSVLFAMIGR